MDSLVEDINTVYHWHIHVPSEYVRTITKNEWVIIEEVAKGKSNKEIAKELNFSEGTVRNYLSTILDKLELRDRTQLAIWAVGRGEL